MEEFFIECVRQYPCLWDTKLHSYKNLEVKDAAWKDILKKTKIENATVAKSKWKNLRDTHREALKKNYKKKSGRLQKDRKTWKYMSQMAFLLPYMTTARDTNVTPPPDFSSSVEETACSDLTDTIPVAHKKKKDEIIIDDDDGLYRLYKGGDNRVNRTVLRDEIRKEVLSSGDPLKAFFDSMYESTKQMPEYYQRSIKRKLFKLVMEAEDNIANTTNYTYSCYYSNDCDENSHCTNLTNYSSGHASNSNPYCSPEASGSGLQQTALEDTTSNPRDSKPDITPSEGLKLGTVAHRVKRGR